MASRALGAPGAPRAAVSAGAAAVRLTAALYAARRGAAVAATAALDQLTAAKGEAWQPEKDTYCVITDRRWSLSNEGHSSLHARRHSPPLTCLTFPPLPETCLSPLRPTAPPSAPTIPLFHP